MDDCIFCKIANGDIPAAKVAENDDFLAFLDVNPVGAGHTLVIPKRHYADLPSLPDELAAEVLPFVKTVAAAAVKGLNAEGFNICQNNGKAAGQVVGHLHFHVVPRSEGDGVKLNAGSKPADKAELDSVREKIVKAYKEVNGND